MRTPLLLFPQVQHLKRLHLSFQATLDPELLTRLRGEQALVFLLLDVASRSQMTFFFQLYNMAHFIFERLFFNTGQRYCATDGDTAGLLVFIRPLLPVTAKGIQTCVCVTQGVLEL